MAYRCVIWDLDNDPAGNVEHIAQHGLTKEDVEHVLANPTDHDDSYASGYPVVFGHTPEGRYIIVVYEEVSADTAYPITAYDVPEPA